MVNNPLIRPYFFGGGWQWGVPLDSHANICFFMFSPTWGNDPI